jgi:N-acetylglucosamine kinase-like BadF-type ATPase
MTRLFIGIEGGATKTEGILIDDNGEILVTLQTGPSNPWVISCCFLNILLNLFD